MKKIIYLSFINQLRERLESDSDLIQVVLGPRQVGKTTTVLKLIKEYFPNSAHYVSAEKVFTSDSAWIVEQWLKAQKEQKILFIDEIQKCHNWSETIKSLYDEAKKNEKVLKCVLLGSSSLQIQKGLTESLTGRFQLIPAYHWNYQESKEAYSLTFDEFLKYGGYPGAYQLIDSKDWYDYIKNSIIATVIEKDILQNHTVKKPALFKQAFEILISYPAQEISYTKLLGQLQDKGNVEIVKYYLSLYEGAFLIKTLEKFSNKKIKIKASSPKILPMAPCLPYLNIRSDYQERELGRVFEMLVGIQLCRTGEDLYYWREGKNEVDYVLRIGREIYAIEVKSSHKKNIKGLSVFKKAFPNSNLVVIYKEEYLEFEKDPIGFLRKFN